MLQLHFGESRLNTLHPGLMEFIKFFRLLSEVLDLALYKTVNDVVVLISHALHQRLLSFGLGLGVGRVDDAAGGGVHEAVHEGLVDQVVGLFRQDQLGVLVLAGVEVGEGAVFAVQAPAGQTHLLGRLFALATELHHRRLLVVSAQGTGRIRVGTQALVMEAVGA